MVAGQVKIREVMFEYKSKVQKTTLNLAADNFVEASENASRTVGCLF